MNEQEQRDWIFMLGRNVKERIAVLRDLLQHANDDGMTTEDRRICRTQLERLERETV